MPKRALITGITGQDGSYLAEFLLAKGYQIFGLVRRTSTISTANIGHIGDNLTLLDGDLLDQSSLARAIQIAQPDEIYNLAAMSHVGSSFKQPGATAEINALGTLRLLEALRLSGGKAKFYQASTSEMFGDAPAPQNEETPFQPRSPYAISKLYAHEMVKHYREAHCFFACSGICFNHESPRRGLEFVTRKITHGLARIRAGLQETISLGNLNAYRDWGYAGEYVEAMWLMLQQPEPRDYVIATGESHSVGEFVALAGHYAGLRPPWHKYVLGDEKLYRPLDVNLLVGDARKAARELGWSSRVSFSQLIGMMMESDLRRIHETQLVASHSVGCLDCGGRMAL